MQSHLFAGRRKKDAPPLVDAQGEPLAQAPRQRSWCRLQVTVTLEPPKEGRVWDIVRGPYSTRLMIFAPRHVMYAVWVALLGQFPWIQQLVLWLAKHWPGVTL